MGDNTIMPVISLDKLEKVESLIENEFTYKGFIFQRLICNYMWHVLYDNHIVNIHIDRNYLQLWVDKQYGKIFPELNNDDSDIDLSRYDLRR